MADLDDRLNGLIEALSRSPLAALAAAALERVDSAEDRTLTDGDRDPFAPTGDETEQQRVWRQLNLLDRFITDRVKTELSTHERSLEILAELQGRFTFERGATFRTVVIDEDGDSPAAADSSMGDPFNGLRRERLQIFVEAWSRAVTELRKSLETGTA